ncbi:NB-ARC domain-containing protein [Fischerella sp. PCC 9605]|uniref:NB-ARC domain-containing protein n=1 Tax=Fischerella sp. PCC 9605 TaxID=1173024 RepID=UPI000479D45C|nr:NB-ARC domain-containing protein [Fischerella sp. PCC 9605]
MTVFDSNKIEEEFIEAKNNWELEKLYVDLASAKGKALTPVEKKFLRGLLCGFSPSEIANTVYKSRSSSTVRVYLSNGLYKYIEEMLSKQAEYSVKVKSWSRVTHLLEKAGYKKASIQIEPNKNYINKNSKDKANFISMASAANKRDWGEASDISLFHGRTKELTLVKQWVIQESCRLVLLLGMGGIGKTALSVKLAEEIQENFEYVIWRSLHLAPPFEIILNQLIQFISPHQDIKNTETVEGSISQLIDGLRTSRCLIVLDNIDAVLYNNYGDKTQENFTVIASYYSEINHALADSLPQIKYRQGYEGYGELIRRIGNSQHQSCLLLTSREKPGEITALEGNTLPVRCLKLTGLSPAECIKILTKQGFTDTKKEESRLLIEWYAGNPLLIKSIATAIQELFGGDIHEFLQQDTLIDGDIRAILDTQFHRLSGLEKQIMYWLALHPNSVSLQQIQTGILPRVSQRSILEAIELLQRRSLIERQASRFYQIPVLMEYIIETLIEENFQLSQQQAGSSLIAHTYLETQLKNYIKDIRLG